MSTVQVTTYRCPHCQHPVDVEVHPDKENEVLICPNETCKKPFKAEVPTAKPVADLVLPNGTTAPMASVVAPTQVATPVSEVPEETLKTVHLVMFRRFPLRFAGYMLLLLAGIAGGVYFFVTDQTFLMLLSLLIAGLFGYRLLVWWMRTKNTEFRITTKRCVLESGVFTKQSVELPLTEIEDIHINQNFINSVMDVGDLTLVNKKGESQRVLIMGVPSPKDVACAIRDKCKS